MGLSARLRALLASRRAVAITALVMIALMLVCANIVAARFLASRLDLTAERLYTLSSGTRHTLARIDEPITLRFYYSTRLGDEVPSYGVYAQRVRELLDAQGEQVYFGLAATNSTDDQQIVAFFAPDRERFLEYDLTKLVHALAFPKKTVVGLMTPLPLEGDMTAIMRGRPSAPMTVIEQLQQLDQVKSLASDIDAISADIDVLMLVHPQKLPEKTLFAVDQFVLKGGKALVFVDPLSEFQASHPSQLNPPASPTPSNLERLFKSWG